MRIFGKLMAAALAAVAITVAVGGLGWFGLHATESALGRVVAVSTPQIRAIDDMVSDLNAIRVAEVALVNSRLDLVSRGKIEKQLRTSQKRLGHDRQTFASLPMTTREAALWKKAEAALARWKPKHDRMTSLVAGSHLVNVEQLPAKLDDFLIEQQKWSERLHQAIVPGGRFQDFANPMSDGLGNWLATYQTDDPKFRTLLDALRDPHDNIYMIGDKVSALLDKNQAKKAQALFDREIPPALSAFQTAIANTRDYVENQLTQFDVAINYAFGDTGKAFANATHSLDSLSAAVAAQARLNGEKADAIGRHSQLNALAATAFGALLALVFGMLIARSLANPLGRAVGIIEELGQGHLEGRLRLERSDEIGRIGRALDDFADSLQQEVLTALERLAAGDITTHVAPRDEQDALRGSLVRLHADLNAIIGDIRQAGSQIATGASQVAGTSQTLSQGATEQASAVEEMAASMQQLASQTKQNADNAAEASRLAAEARQSAAEGSGQMQEMVVAMEEIDGASQQIAKIIKVIDEIAFQTNLLALNAAVEAARAGQHGKGFAVVAEEVRNLAARSARAAGETATLIEGSLDKVRNGTRIAGSTAGSLQKIVTEVTEATELMAQIAGASTEQARGIDQVNQGLVQIDRVTQQNTATAEESAAAAEELSGQAEQLRQMLEHFKLAESGRSGGGSLAHLAPRLEAKAARTDGRVLSLPAA